VEQAHNRPAEIYSVTVGSVEQHVENRECRRRGCHDAPLDDSEFCQAHADAQRRYNAAHMARKRQRWAREKRCTNCGAPRRKPGSMWCIRCVVRDSRIKLASVDRHVENRTSRDYVETDGYARTRFHGQAKRGAPGIDEQDAFERRIIKQCIANLQRYLDTAEWLTTAEGKQTPTSDRNETRMAALGQLSLAVRAGDDVLERNRYEQKRDQERQRKLARTAREIAKTGR